jgi:hypothetical protein
MRNKKDLDIAVQTLCKLEEEISEVVVEKTNSYARECNKRKWVKEKSDLIMSQGIERGEIGKSPEQKKLKEDQRKCLMYVKSQNLEGDKVPKKKSQRKKGRKFCVERNEQIIMLSPPATGSCYFPAEMCKILTSEVDKEDYFLLLNTWLKRNLFHVKNVWYFDMFKNSSKEKTYRK